MAKSTEISAVIEQLNPWAQNDRTIWMTNVLSLSRNLSCFLFPHKLEHEGRKTVIDRICPVLLELKSLDHPVRILSEDATAMEKEYLYEHFFSPQSFLQAHEQEAFVVDRSGRFLGLLNISNHLELIRCHEGDDIEEPLNWLVKLEADLGQTLEYAFSSTFGFVTANPMSCGTGLQVRIFLQLPALVHMQRLSDALARHKKEGVNAIGLTGSPKEFIGDLVIASNTFALGLPEHKILQRVRIFATHLMVEEKSCRSLLRENGSETIKDKIGRAYGLLKHSYQLETYESFHALSLLKLGIDLGWLAGVSIQKLNELFFHIRRGHFMMLEGQEVSNEELPRRRALFLQEALSSLEHKA